MPFAIRRHDGQFWSFRFEAGHRYDFWGANPQKAQRWNTEKEAQEIIDFWREGPADKRAKRLTSHAERLEKEPTTVLGNFSSCLSLQHSAEVVEIGNTPISGLMYLFYEQGTSQCCTIQQGYRRTPYWRYEDMFLIESGSHLIIMDNEHQPVWEGDIHYAVDDIGSPKIPVGFQKDDWESFFLSHYNPKRAHYGLMTNDTIKFKYRFGLLYDKVYPKYPHT